MPDALYDYLLLLHILAGMVWVGGGVLLAALASRAVRDPDPGAVARFIGNLRVIGPLVLAPATVAVVGFGVWLVLDSAAWGLRSILGSARPGAVCGRVRDRSRLPEPDRDQRGSSRRPRRPRRGAPTARPLVLGLPGGLGTSNRRDVGHGHEARPMKGDRCPPTHPRSCPWARSWRRWSSARCERAGSRADRLRVGCARRARLPPAPLPTPRA